MLIIIIIIIIFVNYSSSKDMSREECISWFHGKLSRDDAEKLIQDLNSEGGFLVRESFASPGDFVLTLLHNGDIVHYQILRHGEDAFFSIGE